MHPNLLKEKGAHSMSFRRNIILASSRKRCSACPGCGCRCWAAVHEATSVPTAPEFKEAGPDAFKSVDGCEGSAAQVDNQIQGQLVGVLQRSTAQCARDRG